MRALEGCEPRDIRAEQSDLSGIGTQLAGDLVEQRGLAGAVGADDQMPLARADRHRDVLRHRQPAERLVQMDDLQRVATSCHRGPPRHLTASRYKAGMMPVGITSTMNRNTSPSSMFQRSR